MPVPVSVLMSRLDADKVKAVEELGCAYLDELTHRSEREIMSAEGIDEKAVEIIRQVMLEHGWRWGTK